jgi:hypothetical protein
MNLVQIEQGERDLVADDFQVGSVLGRQRVGRKALQSLAEPFVEPPLAVQSGCARIVELLIQILVRESM